MTAGNDSEQQSDAQPGDISGSDDQETETVNLDDADANEDGAYSEEELGALTKSQLLSLCETLGVTGVTSSNTKAEIIAAILTAQEAADNTGGQQEEGNTGGEQTEGN